MIKEKNRLSFIDFLIIIILCYGVAPIVSRAISTFLTTYFYMALILFTALYILVYKKGKSFSECLLILSPFIGWKILVYLIGAESIVNWGYGSLLELIPLLLGYYIMKDTGFNSKVFSVIIFIACVLTLITTVIGLNVYPDASRYLATVSDASEGQNVLYEWINIGGYSFVYTIVLLYPILILYYKRGKIKLLPTIILSLAMLILLLNSTYTIALLLFIISSLLFFMKRDFKAKDLAIFLIFAVLLYIVFSSFMSDFLYWLGDIVDNKEITPRLQALAGGREGLESSDDNRLELYLLSLNTFLDNPLFGTLFEGGVGIGGHSFVLDYLAQFGILGLVLLVAMYYIIYRNFYKPYRKQKGYGFVIWIFFQTIILSFINTGMWLMVLAGFVPIFLKCLYGEQR